MGICVINVRNAFLAMGNHLAPRLIGCSELQIQCAIEQRCQDILKLLIHPGFFPETEARNVLNFTQEANA